MEELIKEILFKYSETDDDGKNIISINHFDDIAKDILTSSNKIKRFIPKVSKEFRENKTKLI